jgi:hypothetical protein
LTRSIDVALLVQVDRRARVAHRSREAEARSRRAALGLGRGELDELDAVEPQGLVEVNAAEVVMASPPASSSSSRELDGASPTGSTSSGRSGVDHHRHLLGAGAPGVRASAFACGPWWMPCGWNVNMPGAMPARLKN